MFRLNIRAFETLKQGLIFHKVSNFLLPLQSLLFCLYDVLLDLAGRHPIDLVNHYFHFIVSVCNFILLHFLRFLEFPLLVSKVGQIVQLRHVLVSFVNRHLHRHLIEGTCVVQRVHILQPGLLLHVGIRLLVFRFLE